MKVSSGITGTTALSFLYQDSASLHHFRTLCGHDIRSSTYKVTAGFITSELTKHLLHSNAVKNISLTVIHSIQDNPLEPGRPPLPHRYPPGLTTCCVPRTRGDRGHPANSVAPLPGTRSRWGAKPRAGADLGGRKPKK